VRFESHAKAKTRSIGASTWPWMTMWPMDRSHASVELGDGWAPIITEPAQIDGRVAELHHICSLAGRDALPVTVFLWEIDEALIERCAGLGVARCVAYAFPEDPVVLTTLLDRWSRLAARFRAA
jgi:hypothetical protein